MVLYHPVYLPFVEEFKALTVAQMTKSVQDIIISAGERRHANAANSPSGVPESSS